MYLALEPALDCHVSLGGGTVWWRGVAWRITVNIEPMIDRRGWYAGVLKGSGDDGRRKPKQRRTARTCVHQCLQTHLELLRRHLLWAVPVFLPSDSVSVERLAEFRFHLHPRTAVPAGVVAAECLSVRRRSSCTERHVGT